jgi:OmpA-OmpF porin, OOP family
MHLGIEMKKNALATAIALAALSSTVAFAQAQQYDFQNVNGAYVGGAVGAFGARVSGVTLPAGPSSTTKNGIGEKFFAGYQLTENFGTEIGIIKSSELKRSFIVDGKTLQQTGKVNSVYVAAMGRIALSPQFAVTGRLGVARGKFSGTNVLPIASAITGSKTSPLLGVGVEYRFTPKLAGTVDYDYLPKTSERLRSGLLSAGIKFTF